MADWSTGLDPWPKPRPDFDFDPVRTALVIVDLQNRAAVRDCGLVQAAFERCPELASIYFNRIQRVVLPNVARLLARWRDNGMRVVYLTIGPQLPDSSDFMLPMRRHDVTVYPVGSFGHAIPQEIAPRENELVLNKTTSSGFNSAGLDRRLRLWNTECLVVCGVVSLGCVDLTARDAADLGYKVILAEDACADIDPEHHRAAMRVVARWYGMVKSTDELVSLIGAKAKRKSVASPVSG